MPRNAVSQVCMWALTRPGITILSEASMVSSVVAFRLRPAALIVLPEINSSPSFISPMVESSVTSQPHLMRVCFMVFSVGLDARGLGDRDVIGDLRLDAGGEVGRRHGERRN